MSAELVGWGEIAGLLAALAWATTGLLVRAHGVAMHAVVINALRCSIASIAFVVAWPFVASLGPVQAVAWLLLAASVVAGLGLGDSLYFEALKRIGVARAMPISMGYPVLAAIGGALLLSEYLSWVAVVGIVLTLAGVYLVALPTAEVVSGGADWRGIGMAAVAAVCWSASTLLLRPVLQQIDVPTASAARMPLASALLWATAVRAGVLPTRQQLRGHALIAVIATGMTTICSTLFFLQSVALAGAGRAAVLTATSPLFAVPFSVLFLGERGSWRIVAGTLCSVVGVVLLAVSS